MKNRTPEKRKLIRLSWYLAFIWLIFSAVFFMYRHFDVTEHNNIRATIATAPVTTTAVMKEVNDRKSAHYGVFEFVANGKHFEGKTFTLYRGSVGDSVCVTYNKARPADNIY